MLQNWDPLLVHCREVDRSQWPTITFEVEIRFESISFGLFQLEIRFEAIRLFQLVLPYHNS